MRVNAPRFGEVSLNLCKADITFAIICHSRKPPVSEAESRPLLYVVCFHLYFCLGIFPVLPSPRKGKGQRRGKPSDLNDKARKILSGLAFSL
jgi:hypothetical protein